MLHVCLPIKQERLSWKSSHFWQQQEGVAAKFQIGTGLLFEQIPAYLEFFGFRTTMPDELRAVAQIDY